MKPTTRTGLWILLVAGAVFVGTMHRSGNPTAADLPGSVGGPKAKPLSSHGVAAARAEGAATARGAREDRWLDPFLDPHGLISSADMEKAVAAVLGESDPVAAIGYFARLLEELTPENAPAALRALEGSGRAGTQYLNLLAHAWGQLDGRAAVEAFDQLRGRDSESAKAASLAAWISIDPVAALGWWQERTSTDDPNRDSRDNAPWTRGLLTGLARRDIDAALHRLMTLSPKEQRDHVGVLVEEKLKDGVAASAEWALQLPREDMRTDVLETVGMRFLREDLDEALQWAASIADRPDSHEAVADVADALATRDPSSAATWVANLPPGSSQDHAYEDLFENWTRSDPLAASQSLTAIDPGPARDSAIRAFSQTLSRENPEDALVWAGEVSDSQRRSDLQVEIARRWQKSSPDEAKFWVTTNLSPELRARIFPNSP